MFGVFSPPEQPRHFRARQKSVDGRAAQNGESSSIGENDNKLNTSSDEQKPDVNESDMNGKAKTKKSKTSSPKASKRKEKDTANDAQPKVEPNDNSQSNDVANHSDASEIPTKKRRKSDDGNSICSSVQDASVDHPEPSSSSAPRKKNTLRTQLAHQILNSSAKPLKKPPFVVRPAALPSTSTSSSSSSSSSHHHALDKIALLEVFRFLSAETLATCSLVCKTWCDATVDPKLWKKMNCSHYKLSASLLRAIVRRQPETLSLDWSNLAKRQLGWIVSRLPALKNLSIQGTQIATVLGLHTCLCPPLQVLDLSFVRCLNDGAIRDILSPPKDSRPGMTDSKSRLRNLKVLKLAGTDISDIALRYITQGVPSLIHLNISSCQRVTDAGVAQIGCSATAINTLVELDLSSCKLVTELCLDYLSKCEALTYVDLRHVPQVPTQAVIKFAAKSKHDLHVRDVKLVEKRV